MCAICTQLDPFALTDLSVVMHGDPAIALNDDAEAWRVLRNDSTADDTAFRSGPERDIVPSPAADVVTGDGGDNSLSGTSGDDDIYGDNGADTLYGGAGNDQLFGGDDYDVDTLYGGAGDDTFFGAMNYKDTIDGGDGIDTLDLSDNLLGNKPAKFFVDIDLGVSVFSNFASVDGSYSNLENVISFDLVSVELIGNASDNVLTSSNLDDTIRGEAGNDVLFGRDGVDTLFGGDGDDTLDGGIGTDSLYGGDGNDVLTSLDGTGPDHLFGGNGNDTVDFRDNPGDDMVFNISAQTYAFSDGGPTYTLNAIEGVLAGAGDDTFAGTTAFESTLDGGAGVDTLDISMGYYDLNQLGNWVLDIDQGFSVNGGASFLYGNFSNLENVISFNKVAMKLIGNDADNELTASVYADMIWGEDGSDALFGGAGNDSIVGGGGHDDLYGGDGDDTLAGNNGHDVLNGDGGNDHLFAGSGNDTVRGGDGDDFVFGGSGVDRISGGAGADILHGDDGDDRLFGGSGDDEIRGGGGADSMAGGGGVDILSYASDTVGVSVNLKTNTVSGGNATGDIAVAFEGVIGGSGDDILLGSFGANKMIGGNGNDRMLGGDGNDEMTGGSGNDLIRGDEGADILSGGSGIDTLLYSNDTSGVMIDLLGNTASGGDAAGDVIDTFENVTGGRGNDSLYGTSDANVLIGASGNDVLYGRNGRDILNGGNGDDRLRGGTDADQLTGGGGADVFEFIAGSDNDTITDFQVGIDTLKIFGLTSANVSFSNAGGGDTLVTLSTGDTVLVENTTIAQLNTFSDFDFV